MQATLRWLAWCLLVTGCGSVPIVGSRSGHHTSTSTPAAADATADHDHDPALIQAITTPAVTGCHKNGMVYQFSTDSCSTTLKIAGWSCDRAGIEAAFASTGFQVTEALTAALGDPANPDDHGDGYVIDECGHADDGHVYAELVKKDSSGKILVRELEAEQ